MSTTFKEAFAKAEEAAKVLLKTIFEGIVEDSEFRIEVKYNGSMSGYWVAEILVSNPGFFYSKHYSVIDMAGEQKFTYTLDNIQGLGDSPEEALECMRAICLMRLNEKVEVLQKTIKENQELFAADYFDKKEAERQKRIKEEST